MIIVRIVLTVLYILVGMVVASVVLSLDDRDFNENYEWGILFMIAWPIVAAFTSFNIIFQVIYDKINESVRRAREKLDSN